MLVLDEKVLPTRRAEAISAVRSFRMGMAKTRGGVVIGRCGIVNGDRRFETVSNRQIGIQCRGTIYWVECVNYVDEGATIEYDTCTGNSGCTHNSEMLTLSDVIDLDDRFVRLICINLSIDVFSLPPLLEWSSYILTIFKSSGTSRVMNSGAI
jgi:hypothetical protein